MHSYCPGLIYGMSLAFHGLPPMWFIVLFFAVIIGLVVAIVCALVWRLGKRKS